MDPDEELEEEELEEEEYEPGERDWYQETGHTHGDF